MGGDFPGGRPARWFEFFFCIFLPMRAGRRLLQSFVVAVIPSMYSSGGKVGTSLWNGGHHWVGEKSFR